MQYNCYLNDFTSIICVITGRVILLYSRAMPRVVKSLHFLRIYILYKCP